MHTGGDSWRRVIATTNLGAWLLVICWAVIVYVLLTEPHLDDEGRQRLRVGVFEMGHAAFFCVMGFLLAHALLRLQVPRFRWWTVVVLTFYGILGEVVQTTIPGRTPSIIDLAADALGALLGAMVLTILARLSSGAPLRQAMRMRPHGRPPEHELAALDRSILVSPER